MSLRLAFIALFWLCLNTAAWAHPSHASLAEAEFVNGRLEIALQVQMTQLDRARGQIKREGAAGAKQLLEDHFIVTHRSGERRPIKWIGFEAKAFVAWLYFEVALEAPLTEHRLTNTLFLDQDPKQVNTVLFKHGHRRTTLIFSRSNRAHPLRMDGSQDAPHEH